MSNDLISRKAVLEILYDISDRNYGSLFGYGINKACDVIEHAETAFDKEKVIEELKQISKALLMVENFNGAACFDKAIEVIEKGGIE